METVGTDAGQAGTFDPPFPNHATMHGAGRFGLASLRNLDQLPATGAIVIAAPLKLKVEQQKDIGRSAANLDRALVDEVFALARPQDGKPAVGKVALPGDVYTLVALDAVKDGDPAKLDAKTREAARNQLSQGIGDQAVRGYVDSLRKTAKIEVVEDRLQ